MKKLDYSDSKIDIFYPIIYPLFVKQFLFGSNYLGFLDLVTDVFIINDEQIDYIAEHWEFKESILKQTT